MSKIKEVVKLKSGYANFVELKSAFEATQENADRMAMYRPTKAHRVAFERICRGLYQPNDKKFYLLSGSYGTGKSHLCLMTANVLSRSSGDPGIAGFHENYAKLDPEKAKLIKNIRKDGQYLVAICDYHSGRHFEDVVMKAVFGACETKGLNTGVETEFDEAEHQLAEWEKKGDKGGIRNFYQDFSKALESVAPGLTMDQLRTGLKNYDSNVLEKFRTTFKEMMGGVEFQAQAGNLIPILKKLVKSQAFKKRFKGLAIFFDEFQYTLENRAYAKDVLHGFMETICKSEPNVLFVGCIHKDFKSYADRFSKDDAAVMSARITQVDLLNEGIEEIIGAIVETDKQCNAWKKEIAPKTGVFDQLVPPCKSLDLFPWIEDVNRIRERVLEDIYGVHPMALSCLLNLSSEIGSDARSTFTFFSGDVGGEKGSYADFIENAEVTVAGGKLNLYTVDQLFTFFKKELSQKNPELRERQRQFVNGFYASIDALRKAAKGELLRFHEDERIQVLRTILIYQLCQIPTSLENIQFGLYCLSKSEKTQVKKYLKDLDKMGAVFLRQQSKTYELAASTGEDPYDLIERYVTDTKLHPSDTVTAFMEEASGKRLSDYSEAKGYNLPFGEDKRFRTRFVRAKDLGDALWQEIRMDYAESRSKPAKSFEGTLVHALCEDEGEINLAREAAKTISDDNVALAVPHAPQPFSETLLQVKACRHYLPPNEAGKISAQTESRLRDILENPKDGYLPTLQRVFRDIVEGSGACWYWQGEKILVDKPKQSHKPADMLCDELFKKRCRIKHPDLNFCHDVKWCTGKNVALKQAVGVLLEAERVLIDNGNPDNHGEKRYLEKVLLKGAGALKKIDSEGVVSYFACETDPAKLHNDFPVFKELCDRLANLNPGKIFSVGAFLEDAKDTPYGVGGTPLMLSLAHVIRAYGERLIVYKDSTMMVEQPLRSYDDLVKIVSDPAAKTVFVVRDISQAQITLIDLVAKAVDAPPLKHGETRSLNSAFETLKQWWSSLPAVAKVISLYEKGRKVRLTSLKNLMDGLTGSVDRFDFMLKRLPAVYSGGSVGDTLTEKDAKTICDAFAEDVTLLNSGEQSAQGQVAQAVCDIYGAKGDMIECENVVSKWYSNLNPSQRDPQKCDHEDAKQFLVRLADQSVSFSTKIVKLLSKDFGFGAVAEWTSLHVKDYVAKLKQAKAEIDKAKPVVHKPAVDEGVHEIRESQEMYIEIPKGAARLIYTLDGRDPRHSDNVQKTDNKLDLVSLLKDRPNVKIKMRAVDQDGNASDVVSVELVSKERKYEIQVESDIFGEKEATFKCPDDTEGLVAVLKSVISYGVKKNLLSTDMAKKLETLLSNVTKDK
ncbi:MAG: hypothetical protein E3J72_12085 [Planctomycetota bacterium]|nr:MAG: hypothetical protein E3J72_12085 [Planctomycetota bacterium]